MSSKRASGVGRRASGLLIASIACAKPPAPVPPRPPAAGIELAIYSGYGVIDDRRWIETDGKTIDMPRIDPGAALASLVIESSALQIGRCERDRVPELPQKPGRKALPPAHFAPDVRCAVHGAPGRYLVRVLYVSSALTYTAQHDIAMIADDRATIVSRYAVATPAWQERAHAVLYDGAPGGDHLPREVAQGELSLDGSIAILADEPRDVPAHLRRIYDGALPSPGTQPSDALWGRDSGSAVWVWLELPHARIAPGALRVHVALAEEGTRDVDVPANGRRQDDAGVRLPLWVDERLHGLRQRFSDYAGSAQLAERVSLSVANLGDAARDVWVEEPLRPARRRWLERAWPGKLTASGDAVRTKLVIAPGRVEHVGFTVAYDF
jgi:hypothetical protein